MIISEKTTRIRVNRNDLHPHWTVFYNGPMRDIRKYAVLTSLALLLLIMSVQTVFAQTRLHHLAGPDDGTQLLDVILVHGLTVLPGTDARDTWTVGSKGKETWGDWLSNDIAGVSVHYLEYDASASMWAGNPMELPERSTNILSVLKSKSTGFRKPVVFVGHSLGGLVTKQLLRDASNKSHEEYGDLADWTRGVVFLATPHAGASPTDSIKRFLKIFKPSMAIEDLAHHDARLKELNQWYSNNSANLAINTQAYVETKDTLGVRVVNSTTADPGISNVTLIPVEAADHLSITHPESRDDQPYLGVRAFIQSTLSQEAAFQEQLKQQEPLFEQTALKILEEQIDRKDEHIGILTSLLAERVKRDSIPIEDWAKKLAEIEANYNALIAKINLYAGDDPEVLKYKAAAKEALKVLNWQEAERILGLAATRQLEVVKEQEAMLTRNSIAAAQTMEEQALAVLMGFQYEKAGDHYYEAYERVRNVSPETSIGYLNEAVVNLEKSGNYTKAEPVAKEAVTVAKKVYKESHTEVATSINNLAFLYASQGNYVKALLLHEKALAMRREVLGVEHPDLAQSLNNLAELYRARGEYAKAQPLSERALAMKKKLLGEEHPEVATSLNNLAELYRAQGEYAKAQPLSEQALAVHRKLFGDEHPYVAASLNNLAVLHYHQGEYEKAEPLYEQSLAMRKKLLGVEHPDVALSLNNIAVLHYQHGEYAKAEPLYEQSLAMRKKLLGVEHPDVAGSLNNIAMLYQEQGEYAKALPLYEQALVIWAKKLSPEHPHIAIVEQSLKMVRTALLETGKGENKGDGGY